MIIIQTWKIECLKMYYILKAMKIWEVESAAAAAVVET